MSGQEKQARMKAMRRQVIEHDVHGWAGGFLDRLASARPDAQGARRSPVDPPLDVVLSDAQRSRTIRLLLDYDGTVVPIARSPELAAPDEDLLTLLAAVSTSPGIVMDIVSGRLRSTLEAWVGQLPCGLWAEHGFWHRLSPGEPWRAAADVAPTWFERVKPILDQFEANTPGSHLEVKSASIAWHFRRAQREFGARQAHELRMLLGDALSNQPFEVTEGRKVIEVRLRGVSKALVAQHIQSEMDTDSLVVAIGDDRTDEELFRTLPSSSVTVVVGDRPSCARFRVRDHRDVRRLLRCLVTEAAAPGGSADACLLGA
jgi:trehalose 6-phosphate synthase/phosphatase